MELDRALSQISEIHAQVLRSELFRGYRALPAAITSALAWGAALMQGVAMPGATEREVTVFWLAVAAVAGVVCAADLWLHTRRAPRIATRVVPVAAQFAPALIAGGVLTSWALRFDADLVAILPAVWALLAGAGLMASRPYLPRSIGYVAAFYLLAGGLLAGVPELCRSPWSMGVTFGIGQALAAVVLFHNLERGGVRG